MDAHLVAALPRWPSRFRPFHHAPPLPAPFFSFSALTGQNCTTFPFLQASHQLSFCDPYARLTARLSRGLSLRCRITAPFGLGPKKDFATREWIVSRFAPRLPPDIARYPYPSKCPVRYCRTLPKLDTSMPGRTSFQISSITATTARPWRTTARQCCAPREAGLYAAGARRLSLCGSGADRRRCSG